MFWELAEISLHETISVFWSNAESRFGCAICPRTLRSVLWLFTSCVWDVVGYRLVKKKQFLFLEQNRNFPKRRWVSSKNVFLSSGGLDSLVVYKKAVLRTYWDLSTWNNTCCLFKFRVTFRLRYLPPNATFGTLALYILRLRCFGISNTYKNSFCLLSKTETFQNDVEYVSKMSFWALVGLILWLYIEKLFWELPQISLHETIRIFVQVQSHVSAALFAPERYVWYFGCLHPASKMFWDIEYL